MEVFLKTVKTCIPTAAAAAAACAVAAGMHLDLFMEVLKVYGVPTAVLAAFAVAAWQIIAWLGREVALPVRDLFIQDVRSFLGRVEACLERIEATVTSSSEAVGRISCLDRDAARSDNHVE